MQGEGGWENTSKCEGENSERSNIKYQKGEGVFHEARKEQIP